MPIFAAVVIKVAVEHAFEILPTVPVLLGKPFHVRLIVAIAINVMHPYRQPLFELLVVADNAIEGGQVTAPLFPAVFRDVLKLDFGHHILFRLHAVVD